MNIYLDVRYYCLYACVYKHVENKFQYGTVMLKQCRGIIASVTWLTSGKHILIVEV